MADSGRSGTLPADHEIVTPYPESGLEMGHPTVESDLAEKVTGGGFKAEIDTSAPFESVKEAATRFGGFGFWRPNHAKFPDFEKQQQDLGEADDASAVEENAAELEKFLIEKERETLEVLKELETTRLTIEELKQKLPKEMPEVDPSTASNSDDQDKNLSVKESDKGIIPPEKVEESHENLPGGMGGGVGCPSLAPGLILNELKQAKLNLTRTTHDLAEIRASVESYSKKIEKERISLEKTRKRLTSNVSKISCLEEQLNHTRLKVKAAKGAESNGVPFESAMDVSWELQRLNTEAEQFKKMGAEAKSEVLRAMSEMEQMGAGIRTAEIRLIAAKKMKEAARSAEAVALADIKVMSNGEGAFLAASQNPKGVTLSFEEYLSLTCNAREAEVRSKKRVTDAMHLVKEVNVSKVEILKRVEEATEEVKTCRKALEEALSRVEAANREKLRVEAALRKWRSENGQRKRSGTHNSTKFKNPHLAHRRRDSHMLEENRLNLWGDEPVDAPALRPTLSIGQILSRKLLLADELGKGVQTKKGGMKRKVSLGQMLSSSKHSSELLFQSSEKVGQPGSRGRKQFPAKRKKFGFSKFSVLLSKQNKKNKPASNAL